MSEPATLAPAVTARSTHRLAILMTLYTGATMLAGQVAWMRLVQSQVGSGLLAGALSVAAAMAGLGVGAGLAARLVRRNLLRVARVQQLLAAHALFLSPFLVRLTTEATLLAVRGRLDLEMAQLAMAAAAGLLLLVLNIPFGMMLPIAVELDQLGRPGGASRRGGLFYALQSGGAVAGSLLLGLALPAAVGFRVTLIAIGMVHTLFFMWLFLIRRRPIRPAPASQPRPTLAPESPAVPLPRRRPVLWLALWLGAMGMAAELAWLRGLSFYLNSNVYTFGLTTAAFLVSLMIGSFLGAWLAPNRRRPGQFLALIVLLVGMLVALSAEWVDHLPLLLPGGDPSVSLLSAEGTLGLGVQMLWLFAVAMVVIAPPVILVGVAFPVLIRLSGGQSAMAGQDARRAGRIVGRVLAYNSFGAVLGPLLAYGVLLETLDERRALLAVAVGYLVAALWAEVIDPATGWHRSTAKASPADASAAGGRDRRIRQATASRIPWLNIVLFGLAGAVCLWQSEKQSTFRDAYLTVDGHRLSERAEVNTLSLPALLESREAVVAVRRQTYDGVTELLVNRQVQGDTSPLGLLVQYRQGLLPLVLADDAPRRAMVVGLGTGATVAPLIAADVEQVVVAELVEPVIRLATDVEAFGQVNNDLREHVQTGPIQASPSTTSQPARAAVHLLHADGRTVLRLAPAGWDLIVVDIVYPTSPGAGGLFSEQFYRLAWERLADDGLFVHWLPLWQMAPRDAASVVAAFLKGFGDGSNAGQRIGVVSFPSHGRPMVALVGSRRPLDLTRDALAKRIARLAPAADTLDAGNLLARANLGRPEEIWASLLSESLLTRWADGARPASDVFPRTELRSPLGPQGRFGPDNIARLFDLGYAGDGYAAEIAATVGPVGQFDPGALAAVLRSHRLTGQAARLAFTPENGPEIYRLLDAAVQADPHNKLAQFNRDRLAYESELANIQQAAQNRQAAAEELIAALGRLDRQYPYDAGALEAKATLERAIGQPARALRTLDELIERRAPWSADQRYRKALLLVELASLAGDPAHKAELALRAKAALSEARSLRSARPDKYRELERKVAQLIRETTTQPAQ